MLRRMLESRLNRLWYPDADGDRRKLDRWCSLTSPLERVYRKASTAKYQRDRGNTLPSTVPVVVIGNLTVGGTGKTPLILSLLSAFANDGYRVGVVSRGYGGSYNSKSYGPAIVHGHHDPAVYGDEPVLIASRSKTPVVIDRDRARAVDFLLSSNDVDLVISDDGLQHYAMHRDLELVLVDGSRGFGNGHLLPSGPLREPVSRINDADALLVNGADRYGIVDGDFDVPVFFINTRVAGIRTLVEPDRTAGSNYVSQSSVEDHESPSSLTEELRQDCVEAVGSETVHAVTGIGNPARFFSSLQHLGFSVIEHAFPDHYRFKQQDLVFDDAYPVIVTAKDAVKCYGMPLALRNGIYVLEIEIEAGGDLYNFIRQQARV